MKCAGTPLFAGGVVIIAAKCLAFSITLLGDVSLLRVKVKFSGLLWVIPASWSVPWTLICLN